MRTTRKPFKSKGRKGKSITKSISCAFGDTQAFECLRALLRDVQEVLPGVDVKRLDGVIRSRNVEAYLGYSSHVQEQLYLNDNTEQLEAQYMLASLLKKFDFKTSPYDKRKTAIQKWKAAEHACRRTNKRLQHYLYRPSRLRKASADLPAVLAHARWYVSKVLGKFETFHASEGRHGPGASLCTYRDRVTEYYKYFDRPYSVTTQTMELAVESIGSHYQWVSALASEKDLSFEVVRGYDDLRGFAMEDIFSVVESNRLTFVEKDAKTLRPIAIEPRMNLYLQLSVHDYLARRLKKFGVDLAHGQEWNQRLARKGSLSAPNWEDRLATIDLSAASDSVSYELVRWLLPPDWFEHLDRLRSPSGVLDGETIVYEKFSSMGNGFTFALESLIFFALTRACMTHVRQDKEDFAIYGDDIICPVGSAGLLIEVLRFVGFSVNTDKTFLFGDFRESCGKDYHRGTNIRPLFVKRVKDVTSLYGLLNRILAITLRSGGRRTYYQLYHFISGRIGSRWLLFGPRESGSEDSHIHAPFWLAKPKCKWNRDYQQWEFRCVQARANRFSGRERFQYITVLNGTRSGEVTRRDNVSHTVMWSVATRWATHGWSPAAMRYFT